MGVTVTYTSDIRHVDKLTGVEGSLEFILNNFNTGAWTPNNDGPGSGLHADLLDGKQGDYFADASNYLTGEVPQARLFGARIEDTKSVDSTPAQITTKALSVDLKTNSVIGLVSGQSTVMSISPWADNSGGMVTQIAMQDNGTLSIRQGAYSGGWFNWETILTENEIDWGV